jgi:hypothetical protein
LIVLPAGSGIYKGAQLKVSNTRTLALRVRIEHGRSRIHQRCELEEAGVLRRNRDPKDSIGLGETFWFEYTSLDPRFDRVLVPCATLFFAYYASTSQLAMLHLKGEFEPLLRQLERGGSAVKSPETGHAKLALGKDWRIAEIPVAARSLFDDSGFARQQAKAIGVHCNIQARQKSHMHLRVEPPFEGDTTLLVNGCVRTELATGKRILIILEILRCSFPFPWTRLDTEIDQSGGIAEEEGGGYGKRKGPGKPLALDYDLQEIDGTGEAPGAEFMPVTFSGRHGIRFDALTPDTYAIQRREVKRKKSKSKSKLQDVRNSSQRKQPQGDENGRQVDVSSQSPAGDTKEGANDKSKRLSPVEAIRYTVQQLEKAAGDLSAEFELLLLAPKGMAYGPLKLNCVTQLEGRSTRWMRILNGSRPRGILIAEMVRDDRYAYVYDIFRRLNESYSILIFHQSNLSRAPHSVLLEIFERIDEAQRLPKDEDLIRGLDMSVRRVAHLGSNGEHSLSEVLKGLLART